MTLVPFESSVFCGASRGARGLCFVNGCTGVAVLMAEVDVRPVGRMAHKRWYSYCEAHARGRSSGGTSAGRRERHEAEEREAWLRLRRRPARERVQNVVYAKGDVAAGPAMTFATDFAPFGSGRGGRGRLVVHRTAKVVLVWTQSPPAMGAVWLCGEGSTTPVLMHGPIEGIKSCQRCERLAGGYVPVESVYYAVRDGLLKIGFSKDPDARARGLKATLIATEVGGRDRERERHAQFQHLRVVGEWFRYDGELVKFVESLEAEAA